MQILKVIGTIAAIILPVFNIPLIIRIKKRKSSNDVSLLWVWGVWVCFILMLPSGIISQDVVFKSFTIVNIVLFSIVVFFVTKYHKKKDGVDGA